MRAHDNRLEQGDICVNLPKITPLDLIPEPGEIGWEKFIRNSDVALPEPVKFSIYPRPTTGVILSQTCDMSDDEGEGGFIICAELTRVPPLLSTPSKNKRLDCAKKIWKTLRESPKKHYFPPFDETQGPWECSFLTIFTVPLSLVINNLETFWLARLREEGRAVLKDKIATFFTRLAYEECIFYNIDELEYYILAKDRVRNNIHETYKRLGYGNPC